MSNYTIDLIDDDFSSRSIITNYLEDRGLKVTSPIAGENLARRWGASTPDLALLDLGFDQNRGVCVLSETKSNLTIPPIIMMGREGDESDCIAKLELGADDYLVRPFGLRELLARIRAILRRRRINPDSDSSAATGDGYSFAGWSLFAGSQQLFNEQSAPITLTRGQHSVLLAFLNAPGRPLKREDLLRATRVHEDVFDRSIDVQVLRLRRKLARIGGENTGIRTERGIGYTFTHAVTTF